MNINLQLYVPWWAVVLAGIYLVFRLWVSTWTHFLAIFHLKKVEQAQGLRPISRFLGYWVLLPKGVLLDWLLNIVCTLIFLDLPAHPGELVTGRLQRYVDGPDGWRRRVALAIDADKLEPYDKGHIKKGAPP